MRKLFLLVLIALPAAMLPQQAEQNARGSIQGVVRNAATDAGLPEAAVQLEGPACAGKTVTDAAGRFQFTNLRLGPCIVRASRAGYFSPTQSSLASSRVELRSDQLAASVSLILEPGGTISGRLLDAQGRPLPRMDVSVGRTRYQNGRPRLLWVSTGQSDDDGGFRLPGFAAGRYYIRAEDPTRRISASTEALPQATYYPGTTDWARAIAVEVRAGSETTGIDFAMVYAPGFSISGSVAVRVAGGLPMPNGQVRQNVITAYLVPRNATPEERPKLLRNAASSGVSDSHANFEFHEIPAGSYEILPFLTALTTPTPALPSGVSIYAARIPVDVVDRDVTGLTGEIRAHPDLSFTAVWDDPAATAVTPPLSQPPLFLASVDELGSLGAPGMSDPQAGDARFVFPNVLPGRYRISPRLNVPNSYVADIRQGGASLYNDATVTAGPEVNAPVEIVVKPGGGRVRGTVRKEGQSATARVVLIPEPRLRGNPLLYRNIPAEGEFLLQGIAPGEYKLFAWENLPVGAEQVPEIIREYEAKGMPVSIQPGTEIGDITLDVLPQLQL